MAKNINKQTFLESTKLKLEIFRDCFKEWFPVFIHSQYIDQIYIFDFFSGNGTDNKGNYGSPLVLIDSANDHCKKNQKVVKFFFNDSSKTKIKELRTTIDDYISECKKLNNCKSCIFKFEYFNEGFKTLFNQAEIKNILKNPNIGKFILLDQYGFKEIDTDIFLELLNFPKTDFIFFISSSFIKRFREHPATKQYINTSRINFDESKPKECHRVIANYYKSIIPKGKEYYIHHFTIQKENGNYYGLIFGTNHTFGMEKFVKVCWQKDKNSGESNCNINDDWEKSTLFYDENHTLKKDEIREKIINKLKAGEIIDNISGLKYALKNGCEPKLFIEIIKKLEKEGKLIRTGDLNYRASSIHTIPKYKIKVES